ncbi:MAG: DNA primase [Patescibacteria group bacterium]
MNEIEEIKQRLDVVELAKNYMTLRQAGRNFKAVCPLHNEKTPSLMVSPDKQIWHCFGCGAGGDIFALVQKMEGLDFYESLKILAEKAGVELKQNPGYKKFKQEAERLTDINTLAAEFYYQAFKLSKIGVVAREYVKKRGLDEATINKFKIGYAPDLWDALVNFLKSRGKSEQEMQTVGLVSRTKKNTVVDRFRQRLMFPIWDQNNIIVGFTGRVLREEDNPKYLNTAATKLFDKSKIWYGLNFAKEKIKNKNEVIVCEGQMDVIACHQAGYDQAVCSSGTAVSVLQLKLLKRWTENIVLAFDKDQAGLLAGYRLTGLALAAGLKVKIIDMGEYKDPDEMIRADKSKWEESLKGAKDFVDYYIDAFSLNSGDVKQKQDLADKIIPLVDQVEDEVGKGHYLGWLADKLGVDSRFVLEKYEKWQKKNEADLVKKAGKEEKNKQRTIDLADPRLRLLGLFLAFWNNLRDERKYLPSDISSVKLKEIVTYLQAKKENSDFDWSELAGFDEKVVIDLRKLVLVIEKEYQDLDEELIKNEVKLLLTRIEAIGYERKKEELENMISEAEKTGEREKVKEYIRSLQNLIIKSN